MEIAPPISHPGRPRWSRLSILDLVVLSLLSGFWCFFLRGMASQAPVWSLVTGLIFSGVSFGPCHFLFEFRRGRTEPLRAPEWLWVVQAIVLIASLPFAARDPILLLISDIALGCGYLILLFEAIIPFLALVLLIDSLLSKKPQKTLRWTDRAGFFFAFAPQLVLVFTLIALP